MSSWLWGRGAGFAIYVCDSPTAPNTVTQTQLKACSIPARVPRTSLCYETLPSMVPPLFQLRQPLEPPTPICVFPLPSSAPHNSDRTRCTGLELRLTFPTSESLSVGSLSLPAETTPCRGPVPGSEEALGTSACMARTLRQAAHSAPDPAAHWHQAGSSSA